MQGTKFCVLFLLACWTSTSWAETPTTSTSKHESATTAQTEDLSAKNLADVIQEIDKQNWAQAKKMLSAILPQHRKDPNFYLAYACAYIGTGHDGTAVVSLKRAAALDKNFAPANIILGLCYMRINKQDQAEKAFTEAEVKMGTDRLNIYSMAIGQAMANKWDDAEKTFERLNELSQDAKPDFVTSAAQKRLDEIKTFKENYQSVIDGKINEITNEKAQKKQLEGKLDEQKEGLLKIKDEKDKLKADYEDDFQKIEDTYEDDKDKIDTDYEHHRPPEALAQSDPSEYNRLLHSANRIRLRSLKRVKQLRDNDIDKLNRKTKVEIRKINNKTKSVNKGMAGFKKDILEKDKEIKKLELAWQKFREQNKPFDTEKHSREVTFWLTRKAILNENSPGPNATLTTRPAKENSGDPKVTSQPK